MLPLAKLLWTLVHHHHQQQQASSHAAYQIQGGSKNKTLILSKYVNKTEQIGRM